MTQRPIAVRSSIVTGRCPAPRCWRVAHWLAAAAMLSLLAQTSPIKAAPTAEQRTLVRKTEAALKKAGNLQRSKKTAEAREVLKEAQAPLEQLEASGADGGAPLAVPLRKQFDRLQGQLGDGEVQPADPAAGKPSMEKPAGKSGSAGAARPNNGTATVSFTKQIAPLLVEKCGNCHIQRSRGELNMSTYVALGRGSRDGAVIVPGNPQGSRMVEVIESGDMPRGGGKVSPEELALISKWISEGARFDGPDSAAPLASFARPVSSDAPKPKLKVLPAKGDEEVQLVRDLAPLFLERCFECHGDDNPRNNFSFATFERMLQGGNNGPVLDPKQPADSLLLKKLRGMAGARMPLDQEPLEAAEIAKIEKWIALGGRYDGDDAKQRLEDAVKVLTANQASHAELAERRKAAAAKTWRLILPDAVAHQAETPNVLVVGSANEARLAEIGKSADEQVQRIRRLFKLPPDEPLVKGRITLFVFEKRYDYAEVGTMLERREIPAAWRGHWMFNGADAYACLLLTSDGSAGPGLIAQQLAGVYVASLGKIPRWFTEGTARAVAAKLEPKDPRVKLWDDQVPQILATSEQPANFLQGTLAPEPNDILSYSFVKFLMGAGNRFAPLLAALQRGAPFEAEFAKTFNAAPEDLIPTWIGRVSKRR